jgi:hypothetical protein
MSFLLFWARRTREPNGFDAIMQFRKMFDDRVVTEPRRNFNGDHQML